MSKQNDEDVEEGIKVILVGETGTGKTSLINSAIGKKFQDDHKSTMYCSYVNLKKVIEDKEYNLNLWDTIGQEKFRSLTKVFFKNSGIVIFVFDITSKPSFDDLNYWYKTVDEELGDKPVKGLAANKLDLFDDQAVDDNTIKDYASQKGIKFQYTTANNPANFNKLLEDLLVEYLTTRISEDRRNALGKKLTAKKIETKKKKCC